MATNVTWIVFWISVTACVALEAATAVDEDDDDFDEDWLPMNIRDPRLLRDRKHMEAHLSDMGLYNEDDEAEQMEFYFFESHDINGDKHLDGLELMEALQHGMEEHVNKAMSENQTPAQRKIRMNRVVQHLSKKVDLILDETDRNEDGYISYPEYASSRIASEILKQANAEH